MARIHISRVTLSDLEILQEICRTPFFETFAAVNTAENMARYLEGVFSTERLTLEILNPESEFYFAWKDQRPLGYLKVNFGHAQNELQEANALEIERIYVLKAFQGEKVGPLLMGKALQIARERKAATVWLGVWENNHRALHFYRKNGFTEFGKHAFILGDDHQTDILMKRQLDGLTHRQVLCQ